MAASEQRSDRFRSATEFPKTIENLSDPEVNQLYGEMRDCLIFTNRSRAQLVRRSEENKQSTLKLKADIERFQALISQLTLEKQQLAENNRLIVSELEREINLMATHLDQLSDTFETVSDLENPDLGQWSFLALPSRFFRFMRVVKAIVLAWRGVEDDHTGGVRIPSSSPPQLSGTTAMDIENDRREHPQMYTDNASINRALLDK